MNWQNTNMKLLWEILDYYITWVAILHNGTYISAVVWHWSFLTHFKSCHYLNDNNYILSNMFDYFDYSKSCLEMALLVWKGVDQGCITSISWRANFFSLLQQGLISYNTFKGSFHKRNKQNKQNLVLWGLNQKLPLAVCCAFLV